MKKEWIDILDLLLRRYRDIDYVLRMPYLDGMKLINKAFENEQDEIIYERWLTLYPYMEIKKIHFISFKDYKRKLTGKFYTKSGKSTDELIRMAEKIKRADLKGVRKDGGNGRT